MTERVNWKAEYERAADLVAKYQRGDVSRLSQSRCPDVNAGERPNFRTPHGL